ncbi:hypothetical protein F5877DRAFT_70406 [Lentinula edodes]|nr:hypothetical protein F5877DRAFT_70406 [Lentinula edodes]
MDNHSSPILFTECLYLDYHLPICQLEKYLSHKLSSCALIFLLRRNPAQPDSFIGAIVLLVVVHAMPTDPSKLKAAAPVPLGVINPPKKDLWWPLLDQTHAPWLKKIDLDPKNPEKRWECGESYDKNSEVFATDFTRKMRKAKLLVPGNSGKNNLGIFTLPHEVSEFESISGDETVLKLVDYDWEGSSCEVLALRKFAEFQKAKGQTPTFVTSGFVKFKDPPRMSGLVVMRKVPGMPLKGTKQWQEEGGQRQEMVDKVFKNIADFDYELIQNVYPLAVNSFSHRMLGWKIATHPLDFTEENFDMRDSLIQGTVTSFDCVEVRNILACYVEAGQIKDPSSQCRFIEWKEFAMRAFPVQDGNQLVMQGLKLPFARTEYYLRLKLLKHR